MRPGQLRQFNRGRNERLEVSCQRMGRSRADDVGIFLRRIRLIDSRHFEELSENPPKAQALSYLGSAAGSTPTARFDHTVLTCPTAPDYSRPHRSDNEPGRV